ncbi:methyltransferase domain-containing protein [Paenibacillus sp. GCM10012303]|uniref:methyltransferase domain-containing protein n=1 Tax=Paenibacillus sp. GCM10012303 TaxID=3317340 RepID=UPI00360BCA2F
MQEKVNVKKLMEKIKQEVALQQSRLAKETDRKNSNTTLNKQINNTPRIVRKNEYNVEELLVYSDVDFVVNAYLALLLREPDLEGLNNHLSMLRSLALDKIEILWTISNSPEGKDRNIKVNGLYNAYKKRTLNKKIKKIPLFGYLIRIISGVLRLPQTSQHLSQLDSYIHAKYNEQRMEIEQEIRVIIDTTVDTYGVAEKKIEELNNQFLALNHIMVEADNRLNNFIKLIELQNNEKKEQYRDIEERMTRIEGIVNEHEPLLDDMYVAFENKFRGTREEIKLRQSIYVPYLKEVSVGLSNSPILDIGCGRGEWLELMRENSLVAKGIDTNQKMIETCKGLGLDVLKCDALEYLSSQSSNSFGAITGFHIAEHLSYKTLVKMIDEAIRVLQPGGLLILETPNPENLIVGSCNFYVDPTHKNPLPPMFLQFVVEERGFDRVNILRLHPDEYLNKVLTGDTEITNALASFFVKEMDYSIIAYKA